MEKIKRLLEEMSRSKKSHKEEHDDHEDKYSKEYKRHEREEDHEDHDGRYNRMSRYNKPSRFGRNEEDEHEERFGRNRFGRGFRKEEFEEEDHEEYSHEIHELEEELWDHLETVKKEDPELFQVLKCNMWKAFKGPHFDEEFAEEAVEDICEEHGKREARWKCEEAKQIAEKFGIKFSEAFNKHDWHYALNLMYLLFSQVMQDNLQSYAKCAHAWLSDKCIPEGKAFWHYHRYLKNKEEE